MSYPGRAWTVIENGTEISSIDPAAAYDLRAIDPSKPNVFDSAFAVVDEERVAFCVAQATLELRERLETFEDSVRDAMDGMEPADSHYIALNNALRVLNGLRESSV